MNTLPPAAPCADYETDLVEYTDGSLEPPRHEAVARHLAGCPRCHAWQAEFANLDARLAAALPRPAVSPGFTRRLQQRLESPAPAARRDELRAAVDRECRAELEALRRATRTRALLDAVASVALTLGVLAAARSMIVSAGGLQSVLGGLEVQLVFGGLAGAVAVAALGWSLARGGARLAG